MKVIQNHFLWILCNAPRDENIVKMLEKVDVVAVDERIRINVLKAIEFIENSQCNLKTNLLKNCNVRMRELRFGENYTNRC